MNEESLTSPPYPSTATGGRSLYRQLIELRAWVEEHQNVLRSYLRPKFADQLVAPDNLPSESVWEGISVVDKYTTLMYLRRLREGWDMVLREHEDTWTSKLALKKRFNLIVLAQHLLHDSFVDPETREAKNQAAQDQAAAQMKAIDAHMRKVLIPPELQDQVQPEAEVEPDDEWFKDEDYT